MENNKIQIKCPHCGVVLGLKAVPGLEKKTLRCPKCGVPTPFLSFKRVEVQAQPPKKTESETLVPAFRNQVIGTLRLKGSATPPFQLKEGRNIVGRATSSSTADVQIPVLGSKRMSREHLIIDVKLVGENYVHTVSLYKEKVNETYVGENLLEFGDMVVLSPRDELRLPDATLIFEQD